MTTDMTHRIKARLDITVSQNPKTPGKYIVLDANYNISVAEWDGECFAGDCKSVVVGWCPLNRAAKISPADELKLDEMLKLYGAFVTVPFSGDASDED